jgi:hypothetical protein
MSDDSNHPSRSCSSIAVFDTEPAHRSTSHIERSTRPILDVAMGSSPSTSTRTPSSSINSRTTASRALSPGLTCPPGSATARQSAGPAREVPAAPAHPGQAGLQRPAPPRRSVSRTQPPVACQSCSAPARCTRPDNREVPLSPKHRTRRTRAPGRRTIARAERRLAPGRRGGEDWQGDDVAVADSPASLLCAAVRAARARVGESSEEGSAVLHVGQLPPVFLGDRRG